MNLPSTRQEDALRELAHLGSARAASMLARLVGDVGVLVDVPVGLMANRWQVAWLLGGRDLPVTAVTFGVEGDLRGQLWWVLRSEDARRLALRLSKRPGVAGPLSAETTPALTEAANIVASACLTAVGSMVGLHLLPSTPALLESTVGAMVGPPADGPMRTVLAATFTSTNAPSFAGWLLLLLDDDGRDELVRRLGA